MALKRSKKKDSRRNSISGKNSFLVIVIIFVVAMITGGIVHKLINSEEYIGPRVPYQETKAVPKFDEGFWIYPKEQPIEIGKGERGGFAFGFKNRGNTTKTYNYSISVKKVRECQLSKEKAMDLVVGKTGGPYQIGSADHIGPIKVLLNASKGTPECKITYGINVSGFDIRKVDVKIVSGGLF